MNSKKLVIQSDNVVLETFINTNDEISISIKYPDVEKVFEISLNKVDAHALQLELGLLLYEIL